MRSIGLPELLIICAVALVVLAIPVVLVLSGIRLLAIRRGLGTLASKPCRYCGQQIPDLGSYCPLCGQKLV